MKPLQSKTQDADTLREIGNASIQIVHDLKNQLNGLKLYATFLRKRFEKAERPADEVETLAKLIAGLERAAGDMTALVRYGRGLELRRQTTDLSRLVAEAAGNAVFRNEAGSCEGHFDPMLIAEALKSITTRGRANGGNDTAIEATDVEVVLNRETPGDGERAVIVWRSGEQTSAAADDDDPFSSFAGSAGLRMALAAKIIRAHGGEVTYEAGAITARLPL